jgi:phosphopantetheine adenylyltransferase
MSIRRIRRAAREGRYEFTVHALEEMDEDDITEADVAQAIISGSLVATLTDDRRGIRFVVRGTSKDKDLDIEVVCRFLPSALMRIITVYTVED